MITLYTGTPGSGKSLHMAKDIYWHVRMGRLVVANFEINKELFKDASSFLYVPPDKLSPDTLERIAKEYFKTHDFKEGAISFYWDEAQIDLNSRTWKKNERWIPFSHSIGNSAITCSSLPSITRCLTNRYGR